MSIKLKPLHDRVVVQRIPETEVSSGGIYIPSAAREKPLIGKVVACGKGRLTESGTVLPLIVKPGDYVVFLKYAGSDIERGYFDHDGEEVTVMREEEILAILDPAAVPSSQVLAGS